MSVQARDEAQLPSVAQSLALQAIEHTDITEKTYRVLKEMILRRDFAGGQKLSLFDLAARLRVSRTPVKDAINRLASEGLVEVVPRRGTFVTSLTAEDVKDLFELRLMFEAFAADRCITLRDRAPLLADLNAHVQAMEESIDGDRYLDYERFISHDRDFHRRMVQVCDNIRMLRTYDGLNVHIQIARVHFVRHTVSGRRANADHKQIVAALQAGDGAWLRKTVRDHIEHVRDVIIASLSETDSRL